MGWSQTAPALPNGSAWEQKGTTRWENNHIRIESTVYVARLDGNGFAVRVDEKRTQIGSYWQRDSYLNCSVDGTGGEPYTANWWASSGSTASAYYTGTAAAGAEIAVTVGFSTDVSASMKTVSFAAPALLGASVYIKSNGAWKQGQMKIKVNGVWTDALAKIKTGGEWK